MVTRLRAKSGAYSFGSSLAIRSRIYSPFFERAVQRGARPHAVCSAPVRIDLIDVVDECSIDIGGVDVVLRHRVVGEEPGTLDFFRLRGALIDRSSAALAKMTLPSGTWTVVLAPRGWGFDLHPVRAVVGQGRVVAARILSEPAAIRVAGHLFGRLGIAN